MERGTVFKEEVDVDAQRKTEVFRVPAHNNVEGADFYNDFKKVRYEIWRKRKEFHTQNQEYKLHFGLQRIDNSIGIVGVCSSNSLTTR